MHWAIQEKVEKVDLHALGLSKKGVDILKLSVHALGLFGKSGNTQVGLHALGLSKIGAIQEKVETLKLVCMHWGYLE